MMIEGEHMKQEDIDIKKLYELDKAATDGRYTEQSTEEIRVRELIKYCESKGIETNELSQEELEKFIKRKRR